MCECVCVCVLLRAQASFGCREGGGVLPRDASFSAPDHLFLDDAKQGSILLNFHFFVNIGFRSVNDHYELLRF